MLKAGQDRKRMLLKVTAAYGSDEGEPVFHVHRAWASNLHMGDLVRFIGASESGIWAKTWRVKRIGSPIDGQSELREVYVTEVTDW